MIRFRRRRLGSETKQHIDEAAWRLGNCFEVYEVWGQQNWYRIKTAGTPGRK